MADNTILINLRFTTERKELQLALKATRKGTSYCSYKKVQELVNPDFSFWNSKEQRFNQASSDAIHNNEVLQEMKDYYLGILRDYDISAPKELFENNILKLKKMQNQCLTFGMYIEQLIADMKNECIKMPSKNYQCYITLLNKLKIENKLIHLPLKEINDVHFVSFGKFILKGLKGKNYEGLMKRFSAVINKAIKEHLNDNKLVYRYKEDAPHDVIKEIKKAKEGVHILSEDEYQQFVSMDLSTVPSGNESQRSYMEIYRDFCIFLYEMKMRPVDVVKIHNTDIQDDKLIYSATKKKNYRNGKSIVSVPLTDIASSIIKKYQGKSSKGYIFPFAINEYCWDFKDAKSFNKWNNKKQTLLEHINKFLNKVKDLLNVDILTIYTFRHSTFTHKINAGENMFRLAKEGGTSVKMLEDYYYNPLRK